MTRRVATTAALAAGVIVVFIAVLVGVRHLVANVPVRPGIDGCQPLVKLGDRQACMTRRIADELTGSERDVARQLAKIDEELPARFASDCHQAGHGIAKSLARRTKFDELDAVEAIAAGGGAPCGTGVMHGLLSAAMATRSGPVAAFADRYCATMPTDVASGNCVHGIGHGLEASPKRRADAVNECTRLSTWVSSCVHGVMMQRGPESGEGLAPEDCRVDGSRVPDERAEHLCWRMVVPREVTQTASPERGLDACVRVAPSASARMACGSNVSLPVTDVGVCGRVDDDIAGSSCAYTIFANASKRPREQDLARCPTDLRSSCAAGLGNRGRIFDEAGQSEACSGLSGTEESACEAGWQRCWPEDPYAAPGPGCDRLRVRAGLPAAPWLR